MTWQALVSHVASRVRSATAFPDFDMSDPTRGCCGPATPTETTARDDALTLSRREVLIAEAARLRKNHQRINATCSALRDLTTECLRRGL